MATKRACCEEMGRISDRIGTLNPLQDDDLNELNRKKQHLTNIQDHIERALAIKRGSETAREEEHHLQACDAAICDNERPEGHQEVKGDHIGRVRDSFASGERDAGCHGDDMTAKGKAERNAEVSHCPAVDSGAPSNAKKGSDEGTVRDSQGEENAARASAWGGNVDEDASGVRDVPDHPGKLDDWCEHPDATANRTRVRINDSAFRPSLSNCPFPFSPSNEKNHEGTVFLPPVSNLTSAFEQSDKCDQEERDAPIPNDGTLEQEAIEMEFSGMEGVMLDAWPTEESFHLLLAHKEGRERRASLLSFRSERPEAVQHVCKLDLHAEGEVSLSHHRRCSLSLTSEGMCFLVPSSLLGPPELPASAACIVEATRQAIVARVPHGASASTVLLSDASASLYVGCSDGSLGKFKWDGWTNVAKGTAFGRWRAVGRASGCGDVLQLAEAEEKKGIVVGTTSSGAVVLWDVEEEVIAQLVRQPMVSFRSALPLSSGVQSQLTFLDKCSMPLLCISVPQLAVERGSEQEHAECNMGWVRGGESDIALADALQLEGTPACTAVSGGIAAVGLSNGASLQHPFCDAAEAREKSGAMSVVAGRVVVWDYVRGDVRRVVQWERAAGVSCLRAARAGKRVKVTAGTSEGRLAVFVV